jgi:molybdenum cofactor cytidylyltransferase
MKISGLIIAAGLSGRMNSFKPLLKIKNQPIIQIIVDKLLRVCDDITVVTGFKSNEIENEIIKSDRIKFVFNEDYEKGMFTSLKKGLENLYDSDWNVYHFVDQPFLPQSFYSEFVTRVDQNYNWIQPAYNSAKGHPILIGKSIYQILLDESDEGSLRNVSNNSRVNKLIWNCNYPQILDDIDTPAEYNKLLLREGINL